MIKEIKSFSPHFLISGLAFSALFLFGNCGPNEKDISIQNGRETFITYCALCHGDDADGKGKLAIGKMPPPANLTMSGLPDFAKKEIIIKGGEAVGRSPYMPPWGQEFTEKQIDDLMTYLDSIKKIKIKYPTE